MKREQKTIRDELAFSGYGVHCGAPVNMRLKPAPPDTGVCFIRCDLDPPVTIRATAANLLPLTRQTGIGNETARITTVEHLLATLFVLEVRNLYIEIDAFEVPILDGSAKEFYNRICEVGTTPQHSSYPVVEITEEIVLREGAASISLIPGEGERLNIAYSLRHDEPPLSMNVQFTIEPATFGEELAPAHTFCLQREASSLLKQGFGKGASPQNTIVINDDGKVTQPTRFPDEPARHKILDIVGDLFMVGAWVTGKIEAVSSGHRLNRMLVRRLAEMRSNHGDLSACVHAQAGTENTERKESRRRNGGAM